MGNHITDMDNYWLNMYVLLSRATSMDNLLILRLPSKSVFDEGPPHYLRQFLRNLQAAGERLEMTKTEAACP